VIAAISSNLDLFALIRADEAMSEGAGGGAAGAPGPVSLGRLTTVSRDRGRLVHERTLLLQSLSEINKLLQETHRMIAEKMERRAAGAESEGWHKVKFS
jgi:hypothetical protein